MKKSSSVFKVKLAVSIAAGMLSLVIALTAAFAYVFRVEFEVIKYVEKVDDYGFYKMNYIRDYDLDDLLSLGVSTDQELIDYIIAKTFKGLPIHIDISDYACSTFNAVTSEGDYLFARNFDWGYSPSMLVWTDPEVGYASVSMVNLGFLTYTEDYLPDGYFDRLMTLAAPYVPLDGMNEMGLSIGVLQLMDDATNQNTDKTDLTTTAMIRLILDRAANVAEAIALFESYDMHDSVGSCYHYQLADASGASVIIEYVDNVMHIIYPEENSENAVDYQMAANFYITESVDDPEGFGQDRYATIEQALDAANGILSETEAMSLLKDARIVSKIWPDGWEDKTQWSAVYNLTMRTVDICIGMNYEQVYSFGLAERMTEK